MGALVLFVILGLPGLLFGIALAVVIRRWAVLGLLGAGAAIAVRLGTQALGSGSGDNDPRVLGELALAANFIAFLVGAAAGRLVSRSPQRDNLSQPR
jgi:hypothetical protein